MASDLEVIYNAGFTGNPLLPANIFYVDAINGDDTEGTGSFINPFLTLTAALAAAPNNSVIYLRNFVGTETPETVTITHTGLAIIGEGSSTVNPTARFAGHIQLGAASSGIQIESLVILGSTIGTPTIHDNGSLGNHNFRNIQVSHSDSATLAWRVQAGTTGGLQAVVQDSQFFEDITFDGTPANVAIVAFRFSSIDAVLTVNHDNYVVPLIAVLNPTLVHSAGIINWIGGAFIPGITSTATAPNSQLILTDLSGNGPITINKTGNCDYLIRNVQHDPSSSVLTGTRVGYGTFAEDIGTVHTPVNYTATGQGLDEHLAGIDTALAAPIPGAIPLYETTFSHTGSDTPTTHTVTHNLGTDDILVEVSYDNAGTIVVMQNVFISGGTHFGYDITAKTTNSIDVRIFDFLFDSGDTLNVTVKVYAVKGVGDQALRSFSGTITAHTGNNTGTTYTITHNLGTQNLHFDFSWDESGRKKLAEYFAYSTNLYGWRITNVTDNAFDVVIYHFQEGASTQTEDIDYTITALDGIPAPDLAYHEEVISHTGSDTPGVFTITHNLNTMRVIVELDYENGGETARLMDAWSNGTNVYGWHLRNKTVNDFDLNVYNFTPIGALNATNNITVRVYKAA